MSYPTKRLYGQMVFDQMSWIQFRDNDLKFHELDQLAHL